MHESDRRYAGIDVASQTHSVAIVDQQGALLVKPVAFAEDAAGYERLYRLLGDSEDLLVVMEATGHYGANLHAALAERAFRVAMVNPLRVFRFAQEELQRAKTDAVDAVTVARFAAQKRPPPTPPPNEATVALRELIRTRQRLTQDYGDRLRQLHRLVDLGFPELTRYLPSLDNLLAISLLREYPTALAIARAGPRRLAKLCYRGRRALGPVLASSLCQAAAVSVGRHHDGAHREHIAWLCGDLLELRGQIRQLERHIDDIAKSDHLCALLTTIDGIGWPTAARLIATVGDPARFRSARAFAAYVGAVPATRKSGLWQPRRASLTPIGNASLRKALWMPALAAAHKGPWLRPYYLRLRGAGKPAKVAFVAVMRKMLTAVYAVARSRRPFVAIPTDQADAAKRTES